ncbi:MAG: hypothetical protein HWE22_04230 [Flavobacteriales bacterium]|nr:hypothetical protein [Flavobacteriales bacterium]
MKMFLFICSFLLGNHLLASDDSLMIIDSNMTLEEIDARYIRDTSFRLEWSLPKKVAKKESDEWMRGPVSGGGHGVGSNYDSVHNINPKVGAVISIGFLSIVVYIIFRVRRSLKKEKRN